MQFLQIAAVLSLVATGWTEVRAEWFSISDAISQAVLTNPGVGEVGQIAALRKPSCARRKVPCYRRCGWKRAWVRKNLTSRSFRPLSATASG